MVQRPETRSLPKGELENSGHCPREDWAPLAVHSREQGPPVVGVDINETVVQLVNSGVEPFPGEADLQTKLSAVVDSGLVTATTSAAEAVRNAEAVIIVVPLFVDSLGLRFRVDGFGKPKPSHNVDPETLVVYETTLPVGTTRQRFLPDVEAGSWPRRQRISSLRSARTVFTGRVFSDLRALSKARAALIIQDATAAVSF